MADTFKVLAQSAPAAATLTDAYTVPGATSAVISTVTVCNRDPTATQFRLAVAIAGAAIANAQYVVYDADIEGNETKTLTLGLTMAATDVLRVRATLATVTFGIFGVEKT